MTPSPNPSSQLERALNAHFWAAFHSQADEFRLDWEQFYHSLDWKTRGLPLVETIAHRGEEQTAHTRNERLMTRIEFRWKGSNELGQENKDANMVYINTMIGLIMASLSETDTPGDGFLLSCLKLSAAGRRLAVLGRPDRPGTATEIANHADMAQFICNFLLYRGPLRAENAREAFVIRETRNFTFDCYNAADDSVFPALSVADGALNWTFTPGWQDEPPFWVIQKSANSLDWTTVATVAGSLRTHALEGGYGTQYYRVCRSAGGGVPLDPESNLIQATT